MDSGIKLFIERSRNEMDLANVIYILLQAIKRCR
jgi:hypothetical protein